MSRINWIILGFAVMLSGAMGLGWGHLQRRAEEHRFNEAVEAVAEAPSADEYLAMYNQWSRLTPAQKAETPWGQGEYGGMDIQRRLRQDQPLRLEADLPDLDAGVKSYPTQLAEVLYGSGWSDRLAEYQRRRETRSLVTIFSAIVLAAGGLLCIAGIAKFFILRFVNSQLEGMQREAVPDECRKTSAKKKEPVRLEAIKEEEACTEAKADDGEQEVIDVQDEPDESDAEPVHHPGYFESVMNPQKRSESPRTSYAGPTFQPAESAAELSCASEKDAYFGWSMEAEEEPVVTALMTTQPVSSGLSELTEEVSAIRQFAAAQQDQMRKLQDGYDWMIIRRFCMRVIRCVDNLEDRMAKLRPEDEELKGCLEDIRDELVFALESSGVEQFKPDINVPFKGLEKYAEAVRQRVHSDDPSQAGTIAEIVRPGYQYLISDDDVKIVRCAQVKLYDAAVTAA